MYGRPKAHSVVHLYTLCGTEGSVHSRVAEGEEANLGLNGEWMKWGICCQPWPNLNVCFFSPPCVCVCSGRKLFLAADLSQGVNS